MQKGLRAECELFLACDYDGRHRNSTKVVWVLMLGEAVAWGAAFTSSDRVGLGFSVIAPRPLSIEPRDSTSELQRALDA
jgi:hypothetical protein